jgi:hypothetical protein
MNNTHTFKAGDKVKYVYRVNPDTFAESYVLGVLVEAIDPITNRPELALRSHTEYTDTGAVRAIEYTLVLPRDYLAAVLSSNNAALKLLAPAAGGAA